MTKNQSSSKVSVPNPDLKKLYQEIILDHAKNPRNRGRLRRVTHRASADNPVCGDRLDLKLLIENRKIQGVSIDGEGCAIAKAAASLMSEAIAQMSSEQALALTKEMLSMLNTGKLGPRLVAQDKLVVLAGVRDFPGRVKCASLAWHTLQKALQTNQV